jgi:hypothetical protein
MPFAPFYRELLIDKIMEEFHQLQLQVVDADLERIGINRMDPNVLADAFFTFDIDAVRADASVRDIERLISTLVFIMEQPGLTPEREARLGAWKGLLVIHYSKIRNGGKRKTVRRKKPRSRR